jgi:hypothetical protein
LIVENAEARPHVCVEESDNEIECESWALDLEVKS